MFADPTFWVLIALIIFLGIVWKMGAFSAFSNFLGGHGEKIASELDEARKLKEEAQALLADFKKKQLEAEENASAIVKQAEDDAKRIRAEAEQSVKDMIERRTKMVETKIAQAEVSALQEVRQAAVDAAVKAVEGIAADKLTGDSADKMIESSIKEVQAHLN